MPECTHANAIPADPFRTDDDEEPEMYCFRLQCGDCGLIGSMWIDAALLTWKEPDA